MDRRTFLELLAAAPLASAARAESLVPDYRIASRFAPAAVLGIKVNAGGVPHVVSSPAIVAETCRQLSIWDRSPRHLHFDDASSRDSDPDVNILIREPGHVEYAPRLGLGVAELARIRVEEIEV